MLPFLILTFISIAHQQSPKFNFSQFNDPQKMQQIYYLTRFIDLEKSMNLTTQQAQENANFALELWVNTENYLNKTTQQIKNQSIINIINNKQFQSIIPQDKEGMQATQNYLEQWENQTDDNKSIILYINEMIQSEDPQKYNQTNLIEQISNQTYILDQNQKNKNTTQYISPLTWQHANVTKEEFTLAKFFYETKNQNLTIQEQFDKLSVQEAAILINAFEKFFINSTKNTTTTTNTNTNNISSKGEQPTEKPEELPHIKSNDDNDLEHIYIYMGISLFVILLIVILFILRRYLIQQKIITFQMNEEQNVQGQQV